MDYFKTPAVAGVVIDGQSGQALLSEAMKRAGLAPPKLPTVAEVVAASAQFEQLFYEKSLCHSGQGTLRDIVSHCDHRPIGSNGGFGYKSIDDTLDISVLDAVVLAVWMAANAKAAKKQRIRY